MRDHPFFPLNFRAPKMGENITNMGEKKTPGVSRTDSVYGEVVEIEKGIPSVDNMSRTENHQIVTPIIG